MRLLPNRLNDKPQYVFHPTRALRRVRHDVVREGGKSIANLPWGLPLEVYRNDAIGFSILAGGVFDPCVTETLHRLIDPGDLVVDAGANVGYLTGLAAVRAGSEGTVIAFEPHPVVCELLVANVDRWRVRAGLAPVEVHQAALSDHEGTGALDPGPAFEVNMGLATLRAPESSAASGAIAVPMQRLDGEVGERIVGLLKIDVEGHESGVLGGASRILHDGLIRDIVFEDHESYPSPATKVVEEAGYQLLGLDNDLFGLRLVAPAQRRAAVGWAGPSYLATRDLKRAQMRLRPRGWQVNGIGPRLPALIKRRFQARRP